MKLILSTRVAAGLLALTLAAAPLAQAETIITESSGTVSSFSPESLVIRSTASPAPVTYSVARDVTYVDETGAPVSYEVVRSGAPVTVHYVQDGGRVVARKVVVRRTAVAAPVVPVAPAVPAGTVIERRTTTTTTTASDND